jgi:hypothetical protein
LDVRKRRLSIVVAGVAAVALAWLAPPQGGSGVVLPAGTKGFAEPGRETTHVATLPQREALGAAHGDLFGTKIHAAAAQHAAKPAPAPAPVAPPNPYKVAGTLVQGGAKRVYLLNGDRVYEARQGDDLDGGYRVETIADDHVILLYVPLGKKEELPIAATLGVDVPLASAPVPSAQTPNEKLAEDSSKPAQLRWEGPDKVRAGASFTVVLRVTSSQALRATPMQLSYEPKLLEAVGVRAGKFFGEGKFSYRVNPDGAIFVGATGDGAAPGTDAELLVITFKPMKAGTTAEVKLSSLALQGAAGRALAHEQVATFRTAVE